MSVLSDKQKQLQKDMDVAFEIALSYAAPTIPALGNLTETGLVEELGRVNFARKALEKTEEILKERVKAISGGKSAIQSDNFIYTRAESSRTALNQTAAKEKLVELGGQEALDACMATTDVMTTKLARK